MNIEIHERNRFNELLHKIHNNIEDTAFKLLLSIPEGVIPNSLFKCPKQVIIVSKSTYFIDFRHRISLFQKPFAQIQLRFDNILMNGDSCLPFKFSGNMIFTDKKFLFQTFQ